MIHVPTSELQLILGLFAIALGILAIYRQLEVRFVLLTLAMFLGALAGQADAIVRRFLETFADEKFVVPICCAMGFAYVLRHTECDQHLVHLVVRPLTRARFLLIPGTVVVGFLVNMPIISQTSTAVTIGTVVIPILRAAGISRPTIGAAVLLGSSIGGELLNPGAPELRTTVEESRAAATRHGLDPDQFDTQRCQERILPLDVLALIVATSVFWLLSWPAERKRLAGSEAAGTVLDPHANFTVNPLKAVVPLIPLILLYLTTPQFHILELPREWLDADAGRGGRYDSRLIGAAMLAGSVVAGLVVWRRSLGVAKAFFEGAGYGFTHIISLIVVASCFGKGIEVIGLARQIGRLIEHAPGMLLPMAALVSLGFAFLSGSGMAATQSLFGFFADPSLELDIDPTHTGAVVSISAAAGRTMSPVAAVTLMTATLTDVPPIELAKRVALPLFAGTLAMLCWAMLSAPRP